MTTATHLGAQAPSGRPAAALIMVMLFITVVINYLDRSNLSIAAPALKDEFGLDTVHEGLILSAFGWTYAAMQIPGGWLVDRVAPRVLYAAALICGPPPRSSWASPAASSCCSCCAWRGRAGSARVSDQQRVVTTWFPEKERATAIGFYTSGQFVGLAS